MGYTMPPAPRADFFNELLTRDTGLFLPPENANSFIFNRSLSLFPRFSIFLLFSAHFPRRTDFQAASRAG